MVANARTTQNSGLGRPFLMSYTGSERPPSISASPSVVQTISNSLHLPLFISAASQVLVGGNMTRGAWSVQHGGASFNGSASDLDSSYGILGAGRHSRSPVAVITFS